MIAVEHRTFTFLLCNRRDEQIVANLDLNWTKPGRDFAFQKIATDDVTALDHHYLAFGNIGDSK